MRRTLLYILFGYLSGSVLYARVFCQLFGKQDAVENSADQNPGTFNAFRYGGFWCGVFTLCGDLCKGFFPVYLYLAGMAAQMPLNLGTAFVLAAPVIGHIFPFFYGFHGGKGIAVTFGCLLGLFPDLRPVVFFAIAFILFSTCIQITPNYYRTIVAYLATLGAMLFFGAESWVCFGFLLITGAVCLRLLQSKEEKEKCKVKIYGCISFIMRHRRRP